MNIERYPFYEGIALKIGRLPHNDIVVNNPLCSRHHAVIVCRDGHAILQDTDSTYGTFVNGMIVQEIVLRSGDHVQIGTQAISIHRIQDQIEIIREGSAMPEKKLQDGDQVTIGRDPSCDLKVDNPTIFLQHVKATRRGDTLSIHGMGRDSVFSVNGKPAKRADLREGDVLQIGSTRFTYTGGTLLRLNLATGFRIDTVELHKEIQGRKIINNISFSVKPGEFVGFLGPSGSGKTTLLRLLTGLDLPNKGNTYIDGSLLSQRRESLATYIGFVPQDDILQQELSPREILYYACRLRLSRDIGNKELHNHIERLLELLELAEQSGSICRDLSGGQKKRISIGMEMAAQPGLLSLDEPTSNLDPGLEFRTMRLLRKIADQKRTVLLATHRLTQIHMLDMVGVIYQGYLVYFGPPAMLPQYFHVENVHQVYQTLDQNPGKYWVERFSESQIYKDYIRRRLQNKEDLGVKANGRRINFSSQRIFSLSQFLLLVKKSFTVYLRDPVHLLILLGQAPLIAALIILVFGKTSNSWPMLFCMVLSCVWFGSINSIKEICKERQLWVREQRSGLGIAPYFLSKFSLLGVLSFMQVLILQVIITTNIPVEGDFWLHLVNFAIVSVTAMCLGLAISACADTTDRALGTLPLVLIPQILFSGAIVPFDEMFSLSRIISHATLSRWSFAAAKKIDMGFSIPWEEWQALFTFAFIFILLSLYFLHQRKLPLARGK